MDWSDGDVLHGVRSNDVLHGDSGRPTDFTSEIISSEFMNKLSKSKLEMCLSMNFSYGTDL